MICERCRRREANVRYTEITGGVRKDHDLCTQCLKEMDIAPFAGVGEGYDHIGRLLSAIFGVDKEEPGEALAGCEQVTCPTCGTTYSDFVEGSRFGCPDCYRVFDLLAWDNIKKLQGGDHYKGRHPKGCGAEAGSPNVQQEHAAPDQVSSIGMDMDDNERLELLQMQLNDAIAEEEFELAAGYRDEIKALRERMAANG